MNAVDPPGPLQGLLQVSVRVHDLERAVSFYRDRLGLPHLLDAPGMAFARCGDVRLMLALPESEEFDHPSSVLYFEVDDIEAAHAELRGRGVEFAKPPRRVADLGTSELWMAFFRDPDENLMALAEERQTGG